MSIFSVGEQKKPNRNIVLQKGPLLPYLWIKSRSNWPFYPPTNLGAAELEIAPSWSSNCEIVLTAPARVTVNGQQYIFYEWRLNGGTIGIRQSDADVVFYDTSDSGNTSWDAVRNFRTERYIRTITFFINQDTDIEAHFVLESAAPVMEIFPVNGPHNTGLGGPDEVNPTYNDERMFLGGYDCGDVLSSNECHNGGLDIHAPMGEPVTASQGGTVVRIGQTPRGGNEIIIRDANGWLHKYIHLSAVCEGGAAVNYMGNYGFGGAAIRDDITEGVGGFMLINTQRFLNYLNGLDNDGNQTNHPQECTSEFRVGSRICSGTVIGFVGNTGVNVGGPHLHYEVHPPYPVTEPPTPPEQQRGNCVNIFSPLPLLFPHEANASPCVLPTTPVPDVDETYENGMEGWSLPGGPIAPSANSPVSTFSSALPAGVPSFFVDVVRDALDELFPDNDALKVTTTANSGTNQRIRYRPFVALQMGATYELSGQVKKENVENARLDLEYYNPEFELLGVGETLTAKGGKSGWNDLRAEVTIPATFNGQPLRYARVLLQASALKRVRIFWNDENRLQI